MKELILRPAARRDMAEIWLYSASQWSMDQADAYIQQIEAAICRARDFPELGSAVFGLPEHYRKLRAGSHRVIYHCEADDLIVVRIIHEREDVPDDLEEFW